MKKERGREDGKKEEERGKEKRKDNKKTKGYSKEYRTRIWQRRAKYNHFDYYTCVLSVNCTMTMKMVGNWWSVRDASRGTMQHALA